MSATKSKKQEERNIPVEEEVPPHIRHLARNSSKERATDRVGVFGNWKQTLGIRFSVDLLVLCTEKRASKQAGSLTATNSCIWYVGTVRVPDVPQAASCPQSCLIRYLESFPLEEQRSKKKNIPSITRTGARRQLAVMGHGHGMAQQAGGVRQRTRDSTGAAHTVGTGTVPGTGYTG